MAKKRPKQAKRSNPPALTKMSEEDMLQEILAHIDLQTRSTPEEIIFIELFSEKGYSCIPIKDNLFLAAHPDGFALMIEHNESSPVISINMLLMLQPNLTLLKKLKWANQQMSEVPVVRFLVDDTGVIIARVDYIYESGIHSEYLFELVALLNSVVKKIYETDTQGVLDKDGYQVLQMEDIDDDDD